MDLSVKGIFKLLLGTIILIVVSALCVEIFNLEMTSLQINQISRMAARQAADLFCQETYKQRAYGGGSINTTPIMRPDGGLYISGTFYEDSSVEEIFNRIYKNSSDFRGWLAGTGIDSGVKPINTWKSAAYIGYGIGATTNSSLMSFSLNINDAENYTNALIAKTYSKYYVTPANMGIPYLDKDTVNRMFQWNLAQLASNCNGENIKIDNSGNAYVAYNGLRIYASESTITDITYHIYNLNLSTDADSFREDTNIEAATYLSGITNPNDERTKVCVVGIKMNVVVGFDGITPIKNICNYIWNQEVDGLEGLEGGSSGAALGDTWQDDAKSSLLTGGRTAEYPDGSLPVSGRLVFTLVR